jgi:hypothetical protein
VGGDLVRLELDGLAEAAEWARRILATDPLVYAVAIRQSIQEYDGMPWKAGRYVQTVTRAEEPTAPATGSTPGEGTGLGGPGGGLAARTPPGSPGWNASRPRTPQSPGNGTPAISRRPR